MIPTKNRRDALLKAVDSLVGQSITPDRLIIVDQSKVDDARHGVERAIASSKTRGRVPILNYIYDPSIAGAAMARNRAMALADLGGIWLFLDDDVVLERDFVEQLTNVYNRYPKVTGVSGVVTNCPRPGVLGRTWSRVFMLGPFRDIRQSIYWSADRLRSSEPLETDRFTGALMSFRSSALSGVSFDDNLDRNLKGVSDGEDVDFCYRLPRGSRLVIAPAARLAHNHDPSGRLTDHWLRRHSRANIFLFLKHWNKSQKSRLAYAWLWVGYFLAAFVGSLRRLSLEPWRSLLLGASEGRGAFAAIGLYKD